MDRRAGPLRTETGDVLTNRQLAVDRESWTVCTEEREIRERITTNSPDMTA